MRSLTVALPSPWEHPSYYPVEALSRAVARAYNVPPASRPDRWLGKGLQWLHIDKRWSHSGGLCFIPMMGPAWRVAAPWAIDHGLFLYCWDIWPANVDKWAAGFERYDVRGASVTSADALELLGEVAGSIPVSYIPEAADICQFDGSRPLALRSVLVLELGRRHDDWHAGVLGLIPGREHLYQPDRTTLVFASRELLVAGLQDSAISVCFPKSTTHPEDSGRVTTVTHRYFESMAAGCLLVGHAPADLVDLMGYNPVIEVDWARPREQLREILERLSDYQEFVDRNRRVVAQVGTWDSRMPAVSKSLRQAGQL